MNLDWVTVRIELVPFLLKPWGIESYLFTWIRIDLQVITDWVHSDSESYKLGSRFHFGKKLGMKVTFIMANMKIVWKTENFFHVLKSISAKVAEKVRWSVHESETSFNLERDFYSLWSFNPHSNSHVNRVNLDCDWNSIRIQVNYPLITKRRVLNVSKRLK